MPRLRRQEPGGIGQYFGEFGCSGPVSEVYDSTCSHCQTGTEYKSMREVIERGNVCRGCGHLICTACVGKPCIPYLQKVDWMDEEYQIKLRLRREGWAPAAIQLLIEERWKRWESTVVIAASRPAGGLIT